MAVPSADSSALGSEQLLDYVPYIPIAAARLSPSSVGHPPRKRPTWRSRRLTGTAACWRRPRDGPRPAAASARTTTSGIRQYAGVSRGRWEGDTLVVETTHFNDKAFIRHFNGNLSEELHVIERFTRLGPDTLGYDFSVADPNTWTRTWSGALPMARVEGPLFEYACHEGNYGLTNILVGSRAEDNAGGAAK